MKILIAWSGGVVPAYRQFFAELARSMRVRVLAPARWTHGSKTFADAEAGAHAVRPDAGWELARTPFWPAHSARYWIPALAWHLLTYRPGYLYIMDDMDRVSLAWHALTARLLWPPARIVAYSLQNLPAPGYYRWHHRLALALNSRLVHRVIAATAESESVLKGHGYRGPMAVIPLWAAEDIFFPASAEERAALRRGFGLAEGQILLVFAGSLVAAKGLPLLRQVLPRFPRLRLFTAGSGPMEAELRTGLGDQYRHLGALEADALRRLYQASDYAILPSQDQPHWKEQVGRFLIEAILCGSIALGSDSGSIPGLTLFPELTFRQGDAESLAALLGRLPFPECESLRAGQWRNVQARFTAQAVARNTADFLTAPETARHSQTGIGILPSGAAR